MFKLVLVVLFFLVLIALGPIATIWALNTLFPVLVIPYTLETWAATVILGGLLTARVSSK
jgi:hypothetical protein